MCRNIRRLLDVDPPATEEEIRAASLQFVRKITGRVRPKPEEERAFARGVEDVAKAAARLLNALAGPRRGG